MSRLSLVVVWSAWALSGRAEACPEQEQFATGDLKTWIPASTSMDGWLAQQWCGNYAEASDSTIVKDSEWRDQSANYVVDMLNLDEEWSNWTNSATDGVNTCNANKLFVRTVNGALLNDFIGIIRDADPAGHPYSSGVTFDGNPVSWWTRDWVAQLSPHGYVWSCETKTTVKKVDGVDTTFTTFATNPSNDDPTKLFTAWVWRMSPTQRAGTLVHESTHETVGHLADTACDNKASCDQGYLVPNPGKPNNLNAQSADIVAMTHAVDAYTYEKLNPKLPLLGRTANLGERMITRFSDGMCGYTPFLTPFERALTTSALVYKLTNVFATKPDPATWPAAAQLDAAGVPSIDVANEARWSCDLACDLKDFTAPDGVDPALHGCDERWRAANVAINTSNRAACQQANSQINEGVTPSQRAAIVSGLKSKLKTCVLGVDEQVEADTCDALFSSVQVVEDVAGAWPIPAMPGYDPATSVARCEQAFCTEFASRPYYEPAQYEAACYDLDLSDPATHCPDPCGAPDPSLPDEEQFLRSMCHYSWFTGHSPPVKPPSDNPVDPDQICPAQLLKCQAMQEAKAQQAWEDVVADWADEKSMGGCWYDAHDSVGGGAYGSWDTLSTAFDGSLRDLVSMPGGQDLLDDPCVAVAVTCASKRKLADAALGKVAVVVKDGRPGPDPVEDTHTWADLGVYGSRDQGMGSAVRGLRGLAAQVQDGLDDGEDVHHFGLLDAIARSPEAHVALAGLGGSSVYGRLYGVDAMVGLFEPSMIASARAGGNATDLGAAEADVAALEHARGTSTTPGFADGLRGGASGLTDLQKFDAYHDLATAQTAAALDEALTTHAPMFSTP